MTRPPSASARNVLARPRRGRRARPDLHDEAAGADAPRSTGRLRVAGDLLGVPFHPAIAAGAMALSSVSVVTNSLRLRSAPLR